MFSDTSHGETSLPHDSPKEQFFFIDHGNGAVSSVRRSFTSAPDPSRPFGDLPFSPHVSNYPESAFDLLSPPISTKPLIAPLNRRANNLHDSSPPPARGSTRDSVPDRMPSADNSGPESPPKLRKAYENGPKFLKPVSAPPPASRRKSANNNSFLSRPLPPLLRNEPNYATILDSDDFSRTNVNNFNGPDYRNDVNSNVDPSEDSEPNSEREEPPSNEISNPNEVGNFNGNFNSNSNRNRRVRKQSMNYPSQPHSSGNLFEPPLLGPGIGPSIGGDFLSNFQEPGLVPNGQEPNFPFLNGPFIPIPGGLNQPNYDSNPNDNAFQRRRLSINSIHDNSLGYGYPSYTYYKGEDEAATKWPKIFKFTDGRVNLSDFERNKKLGKVKFKQPDDWSEIRRDSFLILHGGAYNY